MRRSNGVVLAIAVLVAGGCRITGGERRGATWEDFVASALAQVRSSRAQGDEQIYVRGVRFLNAALQGGSAIICRDVLERTIAMCRVDCTGLTPVALVAYDCLVARGRPKWARAALRKLPLPVPSVARVSTSRIPIVSARSTTIQFVDPEVGRLLLDAAVARARSGASLPLLATLAEVAGVAGALCSLPSVDDPRGQLTRASVLRQASCAMAGQPTADTNRLCEELEQLTSSSPDGLGKLPSSSIDRLSEICEAALPSGSTNGSGVPALGNLASDACIDVPLALIEAGSGLGMEGSLEQLIDECYGIRPPDDSAPRPRPLPFLSGNCATIGGGWSCQYDTDSKRGNHENSARAGEPNYIAVWGLQDGAIAVVATTDDGKVGIVIVEPEEPEDDLDVVTDIANEVAVRKALKEAIRRTGEEPPNDEDASGDDGGDDDADEDTGDDESNSGEEDGTGGAGAGDDTPGSGGSSGAPGSETGGDELAPPKSEACRRLTAMLSVDRSGRSHDPFAELRKQRFVDPRLILPPLEGEARGPSPTSCDATSHESGGPSCGLVTCEWPLVPGPGCTCRRAPRGAAPDRGGCRSALCPAGTEVVAAGITCVCATAYGGEAPFPPAGIVPGRDPELSGVGVLRIGRQMFTEEAYRVGTIPGRTCTARGCYRSVHARAGVGFERLR
ncbi:MAG: hypothetical protein IT384_18955 [Deltaproteobacteria bacterium]|nr:hypothetical protein [Deltaproteobacteria bacterium]